MALHAAVSPKKSYLGQQLETLLLMVHICL